MHLVLVWASTFKFPELGVAYQSDLPTNVPNKAKDRLRIFYFEALCVTWCLQKTPELVTDNGSVKLKKIVIYTDNSNTYDIFNTLRTKPLYNEILKFSVDLLLAHGWQLRVLLLLTEDNVVADHLSRWENNKVLLAYPGLLINSEILPPFIPFIGPSQDVQREDEQ
jgi:hypothetical protein